MAWSQHCSSFLLLLAGSQPSASDLTVGQMIWMICGATEMESPKPQENMSKYQNTNTKIWANTKAVDIWGICCRRWSAVSGLWLEKPSRKESFPQNGGRHSRGWSHCHICGSFLRSASTCKADKFVVIFQRCQRWQMCHFSFHWIATSFKSSMFYTRKTSALLDGGLVGNLSTLLISVKSAQDQP